MPTVPKAFRTFRTRHPKVYAAYEALGGAAHEAGPLDRKARELVKLGMAIGGRLEGAVRSHAGPAPGGRAPEGDPRHDGVQPQPGPGGGDWGAERRDASPPTR